MTQASTGYSMSDADQNKPGGYLYEQAQKPAGSPQGFLPSDITGTKVVITPQGLKRVALTNSETEAQAARSRAGAAGMTNAQYDAMIVQQNFAKAEAARALPASQVVPHVGPAVDAAAGVLGGTPAAKTFKTPTTPGGIATGTPAVSGGGKTFGTATGKKKLDELGQSAGFLLGA
jgi:hypothetical protein